MLGVRAWVNGELLADPTGPAVAVSDHGLTVGDGVFEAVKAVHGQPFALGRHLERLTQSATGLGLPAPDPDDVRRGVAAVLEGTTDPLSRIRITYTGGPAPLGSGRGDAEPTLIVVARRWRRRQKRVGWRRCRGRATSGGRWPGSRPRRTARTS